MERDIECPRHDDFRQDVGCQVRCQDDTCSKAAAVMRVANGTHISYNCCPPYRKCIATIKAGADPLASLSGGPCERQCSAKLDRAYYRLRMVPEKLVCKPRPRGTGGSSLHLFGDYMRARNVAMDFAKSGCGGGRRRKVNKGFIVADCNEAGQRLPAHLTGLSHLFGAGLARRALPPACEPGNSTAGGGADGDRGAEERFQEKLTIFVSRDDMGNFAHHLGDMLGVFQLFDALQLRPEQTQIAMLDVRMSAPRHATPRHATPRHGALAPPPCCAVSEAGGRTHAQPLTPCRVCLLAPRCGSVLLSVRSRLPRPVQGAVGRALGRRRAAPR